MPYEMPKKPYILQKIDEINKSQKKNFVYFLVGFGSTPCSALTITFCV